MKAPVSCMIVLPDLGANLLVNELGKIVAGELSPMSRMNR